MILRKRVEADHMPSKSMMAAGIKKYGLVHYCKRELIRDFKVRMLGGMLYNNRITRGGQMLTPEHGKEELIFISNCIKHGYLSKKNKFIPPTPQA